MDAKPEKIRPRKSDNARNTLGWVALFLGELRDGLTMINMQSAFLIAARGFSEKQVGLLFFVFGMSQFIFQTPAGYLMDYSDRKVFWLSVASIGTTIMTLATALLAKEEGGNIGLMVLIKFIQGAITALIPPGLNSITQGIVGSNGMTAQVSRNEMNNHFGTAVIVLVASLIAFGMYPDIGPMFIISPIACIGVVAFLRRIKPHHIDHNAARGLKPDAEPTGTIATGYEPPEIVTPTGKKAPVQTAPSFNWGAKQNDAATHETNTLYADSPMQILRDTTLLIFTLTCFLFHTSNGCVLPLTMQSLALGGGRTGILMSGMCIIVAQTVMVASAKICGDYSSSYGRKPLFLLGLFSVSVRCAILVFLLTLKGDGGDESMLLQIAILSTQLLDGIGAGVFGTMYILVTSDISGGTGRFSLTLGLTTAAMSIGGTVSGYLGEMLAEDFGYRAAFGILGTMSLVPALLYLFCMPETLPKFNEISSETLTEQPPVSRLASTTSHDIDNEITKEELSPPSVPQTVSASENEGDTPLAEKDESSTSYAELV